MPRSQLVTVESPDLVITSAPTVTAGAYSANTCVGGLLTLTDAVRNPAGQAVLESFTITDKANQKAAMTVLIFDANPSSSTFTDNVAASLAAADVHKLLGVFLIAAGDYTTVSSRAVAAAKAIGMLLQAASGTTLYAAVVTTGTPTYASTSDVQFRFGVLRS